MPENYFQLPSDSTGAKIRDNLRTVGANDVHTGAAYQTAAATWIAVAETTCANALRHFSLLNTDANNVVKIKKIFVAITQEATVAGAALRFDIKRITDHSGGSDITPLQHDTTEAALPAGITCKRGATTTEGALLFPLTFSNDEELLTQTSGAQLLMAGLNWIPEGIELQEPTLRQNEGFCIRQITNSSVGTLAWIVVFTVEDC